MSRKRNASGSEETDESRTVTRREEEKKRITTFKKRGPGSLKKISELSVLTGAQVFSIIQLEEDSDTIYVISSLQIFEEDTIARLIKDCLHLQGTVKIWSPQEYLEYVSNKSNKGQSSSPSGIPSYTTHNSDLHAANGNGLISQVNPNHDNSTSHAQYLSCTNNNNFHAQSMNMFEGFQGSQGPIIPAPVAQQNYGYINGASMAAQNQFFQGFYPGLQVQRGFANLGNDSALTHVNVGNIAIAGDGQQQLVGMNQAAPDQQMITWCSIHSNMSASPDLSSIRNDNAPMVNGDRFPGFQMQQGQGSSLNKYQNYSSCQQQQYPPGAMIQYVQSQPAPNPATAAALQTLAASDFLGNSTTENFNQVHDFQCNPAQGIGSADNICSND